MCIVMALLAERPSLLIIATGVINRHDERDPTSLFPSTRSRIAEKSHESTKARHKLRIGVPSEYNIHELTPTVRRAWHRSLEHLQNQGHTIHHVSLPRTKQALSAYYVLAPAEASSNLAKYDGIRYGTRDLDTPDTAGGCLYANTRGTGFGAEVKRRILLGAFTLSADAIDNYFIQAQKVRRLVQDDFNAVFRLENPLTDRLADPRTCYSTSDGVDVLVCPTAPSLPPTINVVKDASPVEEYMNDIFTVPASLSGLPALSVPVVVRDHLGLATEDGGVTGTVGSVGMQVIGQFGDDETVLDVGRLIEGIDA
jgi:aspartyl-tRNA(Asn)/glutamyl-tRNA(Gln) amidotransferase subunit A